jgi:hypothetical protein
MIFPFMIIKGFGQNNKSIRWGGGVGWGISPVVLYSGDKLAHVRFKSNPFVSSALFLTARKELNEKWALMGSAEIRNIGFEYVFLNEEYSLIKNSAKPIRHESTMLQFPLMALYKTPVNCVNKRWVFGLGITPAIVGQKNITSVSETNLNGAANLVEIKTSFTTSAFCFGKWMIGREKVFRSGNIFMWGIEHLFFRQQAAIGEINYTYNGKNYYHVFRNPGTYTGIFFRYLFGKNDTP